MRPSAPPVITTLQWVPPFAQGLVRDLRVRWAIEEAGGDYEVALVDFKQAKAPEYRRAQPFGQVPCFEQGEIAMFESGAIVLHIAERSRVLLPIDPVGRTRAITWMFAALNSVEPMISEFGTVDLFEKDAEWAKLRRPGLIEAIRTRLGELADWLGGKDYLEGEFTAGDLLMATVLRNLRDTDLVAEQPALAAYLARCEARPAFQCAITAHMAQYADRN